jgi:hypothetical protein
LIAFDHFLSFSLSSYSERLESTVLFFYACFWFILITLLQWWLLISISIRVFQNIFDDSHSEFLSNDSENFLLNIMLCLKDDRFKRFFTATYRNDIDCSKYHLLRTSLLHLSRSKMTTIESVQWENSWLRDVIEMYETCHEFSLTKAILIDKLLSISFWSCKDQFTYDSIFWTNVVFQCSWWTITSCLRADIQMKTFYAYLRAFFAFFVRWLTSSW